MWDKAKKYFPWMFFFVILIGYFIFYALYIDRLLDADMSSEMVLSQMLARNGGILSKDWAYSTEIRVLNNQLLFSLLLKVIPNYHVVRVLSGIILTCIMLACYYYFCRQAGIAAYFPHTAVFLVIPFSIPYMDIILMGLYYIPHIAISFLTLALLMHSAAEPAGRKKWMLYVLLALLSFVAGLGGPRQLIVLYIPLMLSAFAGEYMRKHYFYWKEAGIAFAASGIGFLINNQFMHETYKFNDWGAIKFREFSAEQFSGILQGILEAMGYRTGEIYSSALLHNATCFMIAGALILYFVYALRHRQELSVPEWMNALYFGTALFVYLLLYGFTDMFYESRYILPIIVFAAPVLAFCLKEHPWKRITRILVYAVLTVSILLSGLHIYKMNAGINKTGELHNIVNILREQSFRSGYGTYWNGNIITELSDGSIEMYVWKPGVEELIDVDHLYNWLQDRNHHTQKPEGKVFILFDTVEAAYSPLSRYLTEQDKIYGSENYVVYGFEDYETLLSVLSSFEYDMDGTEWLTKGISSDGAWEIYENGSAVGPNITLYCGTYYVYIEGQHLNDCTVRATYDFGEGDMNICPVDCDGTSCVYRIDVPENRYHCEVRLENISPETVRISSMRVQRMK